MTSQSADRASCPPQTRLVAWRNAIAVTLLGVVVLGLGCFVWLGGYLREHFDLFRAAIWQQVGVSLGLGLIFAILIAWQRARGLSLADLGWARPTTKTALALALALAAAYLYGAYFGARYVLKGVNVLEFSWVRLALAPLGIFMAVSEETMMRGFFMSELHRARVSTWVQVFASGACSASYHTLQNPSLIGFLQSFALFTIHAALYVLGRRSLTPTIVAHGAYHVLGEPYLLMMVLTTMVA